MLLQFHVFISLIGIFAGFVVLYGLLRGALDAGWTALFLATTVLTSATGFPLPPFGFDPPRAVGVLSLLLLTLALIALYGFRLAGPWRLIFIFAAVAALYLNVFVGVTQAFQKLSFLKPLADIDRASFSGDPIGRAGGFRPVGSAGGHAAPAPDSSARASRLTSSSKEENAMKTSNEKTSQAAVRGKRIPI